MVHGRSEEEAIICPHPVGQVLPAILETEAVATIPPALGGRPQTVIKKDVPLAGRGGTALLPPLTKIDVIRRGSLLTDLQGDLGKLTKQSGPQAFGSSLVHQRPIQQRVLDVVEGTAHIGFTYQ